jgi:uncharacterized protein with HEPN domain
LSRRDAERLGDILAAADAITAHLQRGEITDGLVFDAVRVRLIEIGEAVAALEPELISTEPEIAWADIKAMRNHLAHRYFDTAHAIVADTVTTDLPPLVEATRRLLAGLTTQPDGGAEDPQPD